MGASDIIISIGSKAGIGGFTELKSALDLLKTLGKVITDIIAKFDEFSDMWSVTNKTAVMAAQDATGSMVKLATTMQAWNTMAKSGVSITSEQFAILAARATEMAEATGEDANQAFLRMTDSISRGASRALKEYGVEIKDTKNLTDAQKQAIDKLTKGYEGFKFEAGDTTDRLESLSNNLSNFTMLVSTSIGSVDTLASSLTTLNRGLQDVNNWFATAPQTMRHYIFSLDAIKNALSTVAAAYFELIGNDYMANFYRNQVTEYQAGFMASLLSESAETKAEDTRRSQEVAKRFSGGGGGSGKSKEKYQGTLQPEFSMYETTPQELDWISRQGSLQGFEEQIIGGYSSEQTEALTREAGMTVGGYSPEEIETAVNQYEKLVGLQGTYITQAEEWHSEYEIKQEESLSFADDWSMAWESALKSVSAGALAANGSMNLLHAGVQAGIHAAITSQRSWGEALRQAVAQIGEQIAVQCAFMALLETAHAIADIASERYANASEHFAAVAAYVVAGAAAGAAAGIASRAGGGAKGNARTSATAPSTLTNYSEGSGIYSTTPKQEQNVTVNVVIKGSVGDFMTVITDENDKRLRDGRKAFSSAA